MVDRFLGFGRDYAEVRFGSRRAAVRYFACRVKSACGFYRTWASPDWDRVERLVFVCAGNICRSPYGEFKAMEIGLQAVSGGLETRGNDIANATATSVAASRGLDLSSHRSKKIQEIELRSSDLVLCMEPTHAQRMSSQAMLNDAQVVLIGLLGAKTKPYIPDPYGKNAQFFERCFDWIDSGVVAIAENCRISAQP